MSLIILPGTVSPMETLESSTSLLKRCWPISSRSCCLIPGLNYFVNRSSSQSKTSSILTSSVRRSVGIQSSCYFGSFPLFPCGFSRQRSMPRYRCCYGPLSLTYCAADYCCFLCYIIVTLLSTDHV